MFDIMKPRPEAEQRQKGARKMKKYKGVIVNLHKHKNYGFIREQETGRNYFFHRGGSITDFDELVEGNEVEFMIIELESPSEHKHKAIGVTVRKPIFTPPVGVY